jgi:hypothetical protein
VFAPNVAEVLARIPDDAVVLDIGGWGKPFRRANWVLDRMPYETRELYGFDGPGPERFSRDTWIQRDICAKELYPFDDDEIDVVICSHTLEDVRDPIWVCQEINRIGKAGYLETPSRLEEQTFGIQGPWVGWGHHMWLVDMSPGRVEFTFKHHVLHGRRSDHFPAGFEAALTPEERVQWMWWDGAFEFDERTFEAPGELDAYLAGFVAEEASRRAPVESAQASVWRRRQAWLRARTGRATRRLEARVRRDRPPCGRA